jgi:hypothetical protein
MLLNRYLISILSGIVLLSMTSLLQAMPVFNITTANPLPATVAIGNTYNVTYTITNNTTLTMNNIAYEYPSTDITRQPASTCVPGGSLGSHVSCTLVLQFLPTKAESFNHGPVVGSGVYKSQPVETVQRLRSSSDTDRTVHIQLKRADGTILPAGCSGVLVTNNLVLTAAHCFDADAGQAVSPGVISLSAPGAAGTLSVTVNSANFQKYPDYPAVAAYKDIAWVKLASPITDRKQSICVSNNADAIVPFTTGSGATPTAVQFMGYATKVYLAKQTTIAAPTSYGGIGAANYQQFLRIVISGGPQPRAGDSGGPLIYNGHLIGLVQETSAIYSGVGTGVFTMVPAFTNWIETTAGESLPKC